MKQQIILMSLLTALVMMAGGCGKPEYEPSPYVDTVLAAPEGVTLTVEEIKNPGGGWTCGGTFTLKNDGDQTVCYGDRNLLEWKGEDDSGWYSLISYAQRTMSEPEYMLSPGEEVSYETTWEHLKDGLYRYVMPVYLAPEGRPAEDETGYLLWTEFSTMDLS